MTETVPTRADAAALPEIVRAYLEGWNAHDGAAVARTMAPDGTYVDPILPDPLPPDALAGYVEATVAAFPDLRFAIEGVMVAGVRLTMPWRMLGTHAGPLPGFPEPTGGRCDLPGVDIMTLGPHGIRSVVGFFDRQTLAEQLSAAGS